MVISMGGTGMDDQQIACFDRNIFRFKNMACTAADDERDFRIFMIMEKACGMQSRLPVDNPQRQFSF